MEVKFSLSQSEFQALKTLASQDVRNIREEVYFIVTSTLRECSLLPPNDIPSTLADVQCELDKAGANGS